MNINTGDVFVVGPHKFSCLDIEKTNIVESLSVPENIYMVYSDPPWSSGNARYWRTMSKLDGDVGRKVDWDHFLSRFCKYVVATNPEHIFVEQGRKDLDKNIKRMIKNGFPENVQQWNVFYNNIHPNILLHFSFNDNFSGDPEGMKNADMTNYIFEQVSKKGEIVFDPCVGLGMTVRMAHKFGMICYGNELNPKRLEKTLNWLSKKGYKIRMV